MKLLKDMTTEEICELTEDQLDRRVKLECAEQGIQMMPEPPTIEAFDIPRSVTAYGIDGLSFYIMDLEAAKEVLAVMEKHQHKLLQSKYDYRIGYDIEWLEADEKPINMVTKAFFDRNVVQQRESFLVKRKTIKDQYESAKRTYESSREAMRKIADSVYSEYYEAKNKQRQIEATKKTYADYLDLANGDTETAKRFFDKALKGKVDDDVYNAVFPVSA